MKKNAPIRTEKKKKKDQQGSLFNIMLILCSTKLVNRRRLSLYIKRLALAARQLQQFSFAFQSQRENEKAHIFNSNNMSLWLTVSVKLAHYGQFLSISFVESTQMSF